MPTSPNVFNVSTEADLNAALQQIDLLPAQNTNYTINFENSITLTSQLDAINLIAGDTLTINGANGTLDGGGVSNGLVVYAGNVAIENLSINNAAATGGAGGDGRRGRRRRRGPRRRAVRWLGWRCDAERRDLHWRQCDRRRRRCVLC